MPFAHTPKMLLKQAYALQLRAERVSGKKRSRVLAMRQEVLRLYRAMRGAR